MVTWKLFALLAIFIPFIISGLMYWVNFSRHDSLWKKGILDYTVLFFSILVAIYCWTVPYAAGYNLAVYNLANNSENIPSYYVDPKSYGSLIWISEASKYFIICEQDQPRIYQVNGKDKNFIRNGDYNLKNSFCSR